MENKFAERGKRLREEFDKRSYATLKAFCEHLGIPQPHLQDYFNGKRDPMNITDKMFNIGMDVQYIVTGVRSGREEGIIVREYLAIIEELKRHRCDTLEAVKRMIQLYEVNEAMFRQSPIPKHVPHSFFTEGGMITHQHIKREEPKKHKH